jgi:hypothetical protein
LLTEFGGIAPAPPSNAAGHADETNGSAWGYSTAATADELWVRYRDLVIAVVDAPLFSGFCYTQFADTFQEINGLLFADRTPKIPLERIAEATRHSRTSIPGAA